MDLQAIAERIAARGNQVVRKDKDTMQDTGGSSKGRDREPHKKPPRDDVKNRHREKRKTKGEKDSDTQSDPDMKMGANENEVIHPLDQKTMLEGWGFEAPVENFYRRVWSCLCNIVAETKRVSEKDFTRRKEIHAEMDQFLRQDEVMDVVDRFDYSQSRPEFCAECLYDRMVFEEEV